jgi:hypothetical protein
MDAEEANVFTRFIDDIEVWDGMPNGNRQPEMTRSSPILLTLRQD